MVVRLAPTADRKKSNFRNFPSYLLGEGRFHAGMNEIFLTSQHLRGVQWWDSGLS